MFCYIDSNTTCAPGGSRTDTMAIKTQVTIKSKHCDLVDMDVELRESRVYPSSDFLRVQGNEYRVRMCTCSAAIQCNLAGIPCQWALNSPGNDRF